MKKLIFLMMLILSVSCLKQVDKPDGKIIKMKFKINGYNISIDKLKSIADDPFSVVTQTTPYGKGSFIMVNREGETKTVSFFENGLDTVTVTIKEGDWRLQDHYFRVVNNNYSSPYDGYASPYMRSYVFGENLRSGHDIANVNDGYQTINETNNSFLLTMFPMMDCIAIYDTINMLNSVVYQSDGQEIILLTKEQMKNYDNDVNVFYSDRQSNMIHKIKLNNDRIMSIDMNEIRNDIPWEQSYLYVGPPTKNIRFYIPLFIKIELLAETNVIPSNAMSFSINIVSYHDTVSYKF